MRYVFRVEGMAGLTHSGLNVDRVISPSVDRVTFYYHDMDYLYVFLMH